MVVASLSLGGLVGIVLSGGFVYWEVGRYAAPQVPVTLFDERRELFAYTAGLFVGIPLAVAYLLFAVSFSNDALPGALLFLTALVGGSELAQLLLLRSRYWGSGDGRPFYALGFRAAIGGILALAIVASYLAGPTITTVGIVTAGLESVAVVAVQVSSSLLSVRTPPATNRPTGGPVSGLLLGAVGFFLLGLGPLGGEATSVAAPLVALLGASLAYVRRRTILAEVRPPPATPLRDERSRYGRTAPPAAEPLPGGRER